MAVNEESRHSSKEHYRRKRVARLKQVIVGVVVFLLIIPTICCILMMFKVRKLEKQVESLVEMHNTEYQAYLEEKEENAVNENSQVIHAAEIEEKQQEGTVNEAEDTQANVNEKKELTSEELLEQNTESKKVYLTFDDGPSKYSDELLDVLKEYNVKATFFVIGKSDEEAMRIYKRIVDEGHTLAMHSYTHNYEKIYKNLDNFKKDVEKLSDLLYEATGVRPKYYRFPGGSSNQVSNVSIKKCISYLNKEEIIYFDWNAINGDATGKNYTAKQMVDNVMEGVLQNNNSIVLMHDTVSRSTTVESLPALIKQLKKEGYVILPITDYTKPIQHVKADSVK